MSKRELDNSVTGHCVFVVEKAKEHVKTCGIVTDRCKIVDCGNMTVILKLCKKHYEVFVEEEKTRQEKQNENFKETDFKCPECGEKVFKHYHIRRGIYPEYRWFWCPKYCDLSCSNCVGGQDSHGDTCTTFFCLHGSGWKPLIKED